MGTPLLFTAFELHPIDFQMCVFGVKANADTGVGALQF